MRSIKINNRSIGVDFEPYVIAELSANHNGSIDRAKKIIHMAKKSGADAVKLQTYRPDTITLDVKSEEFIHNGGLWDGMSLYELYESAHMPWDWHKPLFEYARKIGITIFSSPFDNTAVDFLEDLNSPAYKIASFEAIDLPLIQYVASTGKPMIISTGMANYDEISEAIEAARDGGCKQLAILHCVSGYPAPASDYNLKTLADMYKRFNIVVGLSDHTIDNNSAILSTAMGASIIEKHVTLSRKGGGPDDSFSIEEAELTDLCKNLKHSWQSIGCIDYSLKSSEEKNIKFRRSLYIINDIKSGDLITSKHVKSIRPGYGIPPKYLNKVIGRKMTKDGKKGTPVNFDMFE